MWVVVGQRQFGVFTAMMMPLTSDKAVPGSPHLTYSVGGPWVVCRHVSQDVPAGRQKWVVCRPAVRSWTEQGQRDHRDAVGAAVGLGPGRDHHGVQEVRAQALGQPFQVPDVAVADGPGQLDLEGDDLATGASDDEVDLTFPTHGAQVVHAVSYTHLR